MAWNINGGERQPMSFDMKLMFAYHIGIMILFVTGSSLTVPIELAVAGGLAVTVITLSVLHKRRAGWRWPGVKAKDLLYATLGLAAVGLFLYVATPNFPPSKPSALPWYLAGAGIGLFNLLAALNVVRSTRTAFLADVEAATAPTAPAPASGPVVDRPAETWRIWIVRIYGSLCVAVWLDFLGFFYLHGRGMRDGAAAATADASWPLTDHGHTVYLAAQDGRLIQFLEWIAMIGIPSVIALGFLIHFGFGVQIFSNLPTFRRNEP